MADPLMVRAPVASAIWGLPARLRRPVRMFASKLKRM